MQQTSIDLGDTVKAMRPFVPAKDFALSQQFYRDLGFVVQPLGNSLAAMHLGRHSFLLQDFYVDTWAGNFVMHVLVDNLAAWWHLIVALELPAHYHVAPPRPPRREDSGLDVAYLFDPSGVLWHIAQVPARARRASNLPLADRLSITCPDRTAYSATTSPLSTASRSKRPGHRL